MTFILDVIQMSPVICALSVIVGVGLGLGYDARRRVTAAVPVVAALAAGLLMGALAPRASLATPLLTLGFILTIVMQGAMSQRSRERSSENA
jgi:hypothetical protein